MVLDSAATKQADAPAAKTKKQLQAEHAKDRICGAVVDCLDAYGYAETSINRVQERAGVSRGALTHHFPSKEEMMVETVERLLRPARPKSGVSRASSVEKDLLKLWARVVDTKEGRALVEILVAARTDKQLYARISPSLSNYNDAFAQEVVRLYESIDFGDADVAILWTICRVFLRGLHMQERFDGKPGRTQQIVKRFAEIMGPHMRARDGRP
jgi:AcrR family transcriptional regulator